MRRKLHTQLGQLARAGGQHTPGRPAEISPGSQQVYTGLPNSKPTPETAPEGQQTPEFGTVVISPFWLS
jgi:hypothetical protein